ncbi:S9 family peptidase [bacterium]|nr:S9 family peptidase [bacterium]
MSNNNQEHHQPKTLQPEDIVAMKRLGEAVISPDGRWAVFARAIPILEEEKSEYRSHIWLVSTKAGEPFQLTNGPNSDNTPRWSPDSTRIAFVSKRGGDKNQICIIPIAGGEAKQLTHTKNGASNPRWSPDGKRIALLMQEKDDETEEKRKKAKDDPVVVEKDDFKQTHLWVIDVATMNEEPELLFELPEKKSGEDKDDKKEQDKKDKSQRLTEGDFHVSDPRWSPDGKQIAFVSAPSPKADHSMFNATIQIIDVETKAIRKLTSYDGGESSPRWSPDGRWVAFLRNSEGYGQKDLHIISAEGGASTNLTSDLDRNTDSPIWSPDGEVIYFRAMNRVRRHLYAVPKAGGEIRQITQGDCVIGGISIADDGDTFLCYRSAPNMPGDLWAGSIRTGELKQLTELNPKIGNFALGETRVVHWKSSDGLEIEGLLCLPVGYETGQRYPLIVEPHGGPHGGARDLEFKSQWQYFSGEGFAIFAPNFRGSDGYGRDFARANYSDWGIGDYQDIMTGIDHLIDQGIADPERLVVGGWSYGGYMTSWMVTQTDRFKAAMNGCGVTNLVSMYGQTDIPSFMRLYFEDAPSKKLELYHKHSPISYIHRVKTPTLILHGAEDKRVPLPQAEEFYACLKSIGVDVEFVKYPREGHGIGEPRHVLDLLKRHLSWYKKYINEND